MSWKETCALKERLKMVSLYETGKYTVTELAQQFGVSRKTAHKWLGRFAAEGISGLDECSRAPHRCPRAIPAEVVLAVVRAKQAHPSPWEGPAKLAPCPDEPPEIARGWPAVSTRGRILGLHGLVTRRRHRRRASPWFQPFLPDEQVWNHLKNHGVGKIPITGPDQLKRRILSHLRKLQKLPTFVRSFFGMPEIVYAAI